MIVSYIDIYINNTKMNEYVILQNLPRLVRGLYQSINQQIQNERTDLIRGLLRQIIDDGNNPVHTRPQELAYILKLSYKMRKNSLLAIRYFRDRNVVYYLMVSEMIYTLSIIKNKCIENDLNRGCLRRICNITRKLYEIIDINNRRYIQNQVNGTETGR